MNIIEAIILGLIQGLTEFIPISSSGHLDIIPKILGWQNPSTTFILFLHLGTLLSLLVHFRKLISRYLKVLNKKFFRRSKLKRKEERDLKAIKSVSISILPALVLGVLLENAISNFYDFETNLKVIGPIVLIPLIFFGIIFLFESKIFRNNNKEIDDLSPQNSLIVGLSQALAFIRGVSRSGITLLSGQAMGLKRVAAAEFSFLISIPILFATSIYSIYKLISSSQNQFYNELGIAVVGMLAAFITGLIAVSFLLKYLRTNSLRIFGIYRIFLGLLLLGIIFID